MNEGQSDQKKSHLLGDYKLFWCVCVNERDRERQRKHVSHFCAGFTQQNIQP